MFASDLSGLPNGLACDDFGQVFIRRYEPSRILRLSRDGTRCNVYVEDATAHILAHPTNLVFSHSSFYAAHLGRWHITRIASDTFSVPLWHSTSSL